MAGTSRGKQIEAVSTMSWFYCCCCIGFVVIGGLMVNCITQNGYTTYSFWERIYVGSFVLGGMSAFFVVVLCSVSKADKEGRPHDVSKGIQCVNCLLYGSISALGFGIGFTAVFIKESNVFEPCMNYTDSNTTPLYDKKEECMENCKGLTIGHLVFLVIFFLLMLWGCSERSKKNEQLLSVEPAVQHISRNTDLKSTDGNSSSLTAGIPTTSLKDTKEQKLIVTSKNNWTTENSTKNRTPNNKTINRIHSDPSLRTRSETSDIPTPTTQDNNKLQLYYIDDSSGYGNEHMPGTELYSHSHLSDNPPPPLASVFGDSGTLVHRQRLPPIPNYKSSTTEPKVLPPSYEDALVGKY